MHIFPHAFSNTSELCMRVTPTMATRVSIISSSNSRVIYNRYLWLFSYSCGWYSGYTINNYPKIGQSVAVPVFNCISQHLIQDDFFISSHLSAPRKNNAVSCILLPIRKHNLWSSRVKFETIGSEKISYNYAIIKCELIKISNLHNHDLSIIFSIFLCQKPSMPLLIALFQSFNVF